MRSFEPALAVMSAPFASVAATLDHRIDDHAILSALLAKSCRPTGSDFAFLESSTPAPMLQSLFGGAVDKAPLQDQAALRNLLLRNTVSQPLPSGVGCHGVRIEERTIIDQALAKEWEGTQLTLSLPGYNAAGDQAVVYEGINCTNGPRCGGGWLIELRKSGGQWLEVKQFQAWWS
jgi:hypothetical protein